MSRTSQIIYPEYTNNNIIQEVKNPPKKYNKKPRVLLIDADSLAFLSTYKCEEDIEECKFRVRKKIQEIVSNVEEYFNITKTVLFVGGDNNFRYSLLPEYKANRGEKHSSVDIIKKYMIDELYAIPAEHGEADDCIFEAYHICNKNCIVATIDKDILYHCHSVPIYYYKNYDEVIGEFKYVSEEKSRYKTAIQYLIGDNCDGVNLSPGIGEKYAEKNLQLGMTDYQYLKAIYKGYLKAWKGNSKLAKENMKLSYNLLRLYTRDDIRKLNLVDS